MAFSSGGGDGGGTGRDSALSLRISGATGNCADSVNGVFEVTDEVSGSMPIYRKLGGAIWIEYRTQTSKWIVRSTQNKGQNSAGGVAYVNCVPGLFPQQARAGSWNVVVNNTFFVQSNIVVTVVQQAEVEAEIATRTAALESAAAAARAAATYALRISGATGNLAALVNGLYEVTDEVSGGLPVYRKQGGAYWLEYRVATSKWLSRSTASKGQTNGGGTAYVTCEAGILPNQAQAGAWMVAVNGNYVQQESVVVSPVDSAEAAVEIMAAVAAVQAACAAAREAATYAVCISGATGNNSSLVNGRYEVTDEVSGGMPVYKKQGNDQMWLEFYVSTYRWLSRSTSSRGQETGAAYGFGDCQPGMLPDTAAPGNWHVAVNGVFVRQPGVVLTTNKT